MVNFPYLVCKKYDARRRPYPEDTQAVPLDAENFEKYASALLRGVSSLVKEAILMQNLNLTAELGLQRRVTPFPTKEPVIIAPKRMKDRALTNETDASVRANLLLRSLADCAAGRQAGVDAILASEGPQLLGVANRILGRRDLAEEALQDAMLQIWQKAKQFESETGSARGWIYAILRNRCLNILRDGKRLSTLPPADLAGLQESRQRLVPEEGWEILAGPSRIRDCLAALDGKSRHFILLAHVAGFSHAEISTRQDVPLGTIKSLIRRGLHTLKECLT